MTPAALRQIFDAHQEGLYTAMPGIVKSYDAAKQTASVQPALQSITRAVDDDEPDLVESLPVLAEVPVLWPRGGGQFSHFPMAAGDSVLLVFCQQDINAWRRDGGEVDPGTLDRHGLSGAVAVPGFFPSTAPIPGLSSQYAEIGAESGARVEFRPSEIRAGGSDTLAKFAALDAHLGAIAAALDALSTLIALGVPTPQTNYGVLAKEVLDAAQPIPTLVLKGS